MLKSTSKSSLFPFVRPGCITWRSSPGYSLDLYNLTLCRTMVLAGCKVFQDQKVKLPKLFPPTGRSSIAGVHQKRWSFIQVAQPMRMSPARGWLRHQREADNSSPPLRLLNGHGKPGNRNSLSQIYISHSAVHDWSAEEGYAVLQYSRERFKRLTVDRLCRVASWSIRDLQSLYKWSQGCLLQASWKWVNIENHWKDSFEVTESTS